jgi:hypothetical protein
MDCNVLSCHVKIRVFSNKQDTPGSTGTIKSNIQAKRIYAHL